MKYDVKPSNQFKKDLKLAAKRGYKIELLTEIIKKLANGEVLEPKYKDHQLSGNFGFYRECHIQPDWLLIYEIDGEQLILILSRTGTHSDLF